LRKAARVFSGAIPEAPRCAITHTYEAWLLTSYKI
jgi:hypothetical protein